MKVLIGAATMAVLLCGAAAAQETIGGDLPANYQPPASRCAALAAPPSLPEGSQASAPQMNEAMAAFSAWETSYRETLTCRRTEAQEAQAIQQARTQEFNSSIQAYNATVASWTAEVEEYNSRQGNRRHRQ